MPTALPATDDPSTTAALKTRFLSLMLGLAVVLFAIQPAIAAEIQTDLWIYRYGDTVTVTGVEYAPGETVELVTTDPDGVEADRGTAITDAGGRLHLPVRAAFRRRWHLRRRRRGPDEAGNVGNGAFGLKYDETDPTVSIGLSPASPNGDNGWYTSGVTVTVTSGDDTSGVASTEYRVDGGSWMPYAVAFLVSGDGNHTVEARVSDNADNDASAGPTAFMIDMSDPLVAITSPADGSSTIALSTAVSGTVSDVPSGVASVSVNTYVATLGAGTFSVSSVPLNCGANTLTALATDNAGNTSTHAITVTRTCFSGLHYYAPLDESVTTPVINTGKYGRVIPTKVTLALADGTLLTDTVMAASGWTLQIGVNSAVCATGVSTDSVEAYADAGMSNAGTNLFRWTNGQWMYNLDTKAPPSMTMTINSCYRLDVYVSDGTNKVKVSTVTYAIFKPTK